MHVKNNNIWHDIFFVKESIFAHRYSTNPHYDDWMALYESFHNSSHTLSIDVTHSLGDLWSHVPSSYQHMFIKKLKTLHFHMRDHHVETYFTFYKTFIPHSQWNTFLADIEYFHYQSHDRNWGLLSSTERIDLWFASLHSNKPLLREWWEWSQEDWVYFVGRSTNATLYYFLWNEDLSPLFFHIPRKIHPMIHLEELRDPIKRWNLLDLKEFFKPQILTEQIEITHTL